MLLLMVLIVMTLGILMLQLLILMILEMLRLIESIEEAGSTFDAFAAPTALGNDAGNEEAGSTTGYAFYALSTVPSTAQGNYVYGNDP
jgi:hypothetical protein